MFLLNTLPKTVLQNKKRVGRGEGSGRGKNCGAGHKGQKKHGKGVPTTFEGGGKTLVRRLPKYKGFKQPVNKKLMVFPVSVLSIFEDKETVNLASLLEKGLINDKIQYVRFIATGKLDKKLKVEESENIYLTSGAKKLIS